MEGWGRVCGRRCRGAEGRVFGMCVTYAPNGENLHANVYLHSFACKRVSDPAKIQRIFQTRAFAHAQNGG